MTPTKRKCSLCFSTEHDKRWHTKRWNLLTIDDVIAYLRKELEVWVRMEEKARFRHTALDQRLHWTSWIELTGQKLGRSCVIGGPEHCYSEIVSVEYDEYGHAVKTRKCSHCGRESTRYGIRIIRNGTKKMKVPKTQREIKE